MSTIKANTLLHSDGTTTNPPAIPALDKRMVKAWVNFNGIGTLAIRDSEGVSSVTDSSVGNYLVNFATAMANTNYCAIASTERTSTWADGGVNVINFLTTRFHLQNVENTAAVDTAIFSVAVIA
tara:strand:+ start:260 stop:631 length:372 start_codon:yes stop_codon:yes gene_type:complete